MKTEKFIIGNDYVSSDKTINIVNPYSGEIVKKVFSAESSHIDSSLNYLSDTFEEFKNTPSYLRAQLLEKISDKISIRKEEISKIITLETGKPIKFSRIETERAIFTFKNGAEEARRINGDIIPLDQFKGAEKKQGFVKRFPIGVILGVTPWNFPVNLVAHKVAPALASGNTILLKPASASMVCGIEIAKIVKDAAQELSLNYTPMNVVTATGKIIEKFVSDERIKMVSFTGSPVIGWELKKKLNKQKISLELGGNAGVIVDEDADYISAIPKIVTGAFYSAGQSCISVQRVFVHKNIYDVFKKELLSFASSIKSGDPNDDTTLSGPMINENEAIRVEEWVNDAVGKGGEILIGGKRNKAIIEPTIIENAPLACDVNTKEIFAPVFTLNKFSDFEEAIKKVNDSIYGLQAGIFTNNLNNTMYAFENLETGGVVINEPSSYRIDSMPYGGIKNSGYGREGVKYAIEEMTEQKILII